MTLLFVGPGGDPAADTLRDVGRQVCLSVPSAGAHSVVELWDVDADRPNVDAELAQGAHVLYFGHGFSQTLSRPALVDTSNVSGASGAIVLAMACSSARGLGADAVNNEGVRAYLGFTRPVFVPTRPATWSLTPWYVAGTQLMSGATVQTARDDARQAFRDEGDRILANGKRPYADRVNDMLIAYGTAYAFVYVGDGSASV